MSTTSKTLIPQSFPYTNLMNQLQQQQLQALYYSQFQQQKNHNTIQQYQHQQPFFSPPQNLLQNLIQNQQQHMSSTQMSQQTSPSVNKFNPINSQMQSFLQQQQRNMTMNLQHQWQQQQPGGNNFSCKQSVAQQNPQQQQMNSLLKNTPQNNAQQIQNPQRNNLSKQQIKNIRQRKKSKKSKKSILKCQNFSICKNFAANLHSINIKKKKKRLLLCSHCVKYFKMKQYCGYCHVIYSDQNTDDKEWIECDSQNCKRWTHVDCEQLYGSSQIRQRIHQGCQYFCPHCKKRQKRNNKKEQGLSQISSSNDSSMNKSGSLLGRKRKATVSYSQEKIISDEKIEYFPHLHPIFIQPRLSKVDLSAKYGLSISATNKEIQDDLKELQG